MAEINDRVAKLAQDADSLIEQVNILEEAVDGFPQKVKDAVQQALADNNIANQAAQDAIDAIDAKVTAERDDILARSQAAAPAPAPEAAPEEPAAPAEEPAPANPEGDAGA